MARPSPPVIIGAVVGTDQVQVTAGATDGTVLGQGHAAAGGPGKTAETAPGQAAEKLPGEATKGLLAEALHLALEHAQVVPAAVLVGMIAVPVSDSAGRQQAAAAASDAWAAAELPGCPAVVDAEVAAHAAGSTRRGGLVLMADAGAGAAAVTGHEVVARADAAGWLLGDEGGNVYLGLSAARAALRALDGRGTETALLPAVLAGLRLQDFQDTNETARRIISAIDSLPPQELGRLGPVVTEAAAAGDPVARDICERAAEALLGSLDAVRAGVPSLANDPPVTAGQVLASGPVADIVSAGIFARYGKAPLPAGSMAGGAAWLALQVVHGKFAPRSAHARLTHPHQPSPR